MNPGVVWVALRSSRKGDRLAWHDRPKCQRSERMVPTLRDYAEAVGMVRCAVCERAERNQKRREVVHRMHEELGLSYREISIRLAAVYDVGPEAIRKDYWRGVA